MDSKMERKRKREEMGQPSSQDTEWVFGFHHLSLSLSRECSCLTEGCCKQHGESPQAKLMILDGAISEVQKLLSCSQITPIFTPEECLKISSCASFLVSPPHFANYASQLYEKFVGAVRGSIVSVILPALDGKEGFPLLIEILGIWTKFKAMLYWLLICFEPLKTYCTLTKRTPLMETSINLICELAVDPVWEKLRDQVVHLINLERNGGRIDRNLIKTGVDLFVEMGVFGNNSYHQNFEERLLSEYGSHYGRLASKYFLTNSLDDFTRKAMHFIRLEERRMTYYLPEATVLKMVERIRKELID